MSGVGRERKRSESSGHGVMDGERTLMKEGKMNDIPISFTVFFFFRFYFRDGAMMRLLVLGGVFF
jgi:hypothetical protein